MSVTVEDYAFFADFIRKRSAISIGPDKEYLVESRLAPVARAAGMTGVSELIGALRRPFPDPAVRDLVVEAMTTNETSFFRDIRPFDALREVLVPQVLQRNATTRRLGIWSAASSTGQELYSIAMLLDTHFPTLAGWDVQLHGTDLSNAVLAKARAGRYSPLEVNRGLPECMSRRYLRREGADWVVNERLRRRCRFEQLNLAGTWPVLPIFDIVFCRNVLIYFDPDARRSILQRIKRLLAPGGHLVLGAAESANLIDGFVPVRLAGAVVFRLADR